MRTAPAAKVFTRSGRRWLMSFRAVAGVVVLTTAVWAIERGDSLAILVAVGVGAYVGGILWAWRHPSAWQLAWDGEHWHLQSEGAVAPQRGEIEIMLDLGEALLLRFQASGRPGRTWLPLQRGDSVTDWHALRCALYAPRSVHLNLKGASDDC